MTSFVLFFSSEWNQKNLFCGWYDADLSEKGFEEAIQAGKVRFYSSKTSQFIICFFSSGLKKADIHLM